MKGVKKMIKKDGNTMIIDTFRDLKSSSAEFNKAKRKTVKLIVKSAEHDQKVIDIINFVLLTECCIPETAKTCISVQGLAL